MSTHDDTTHIWELDDWMHWRCSCPDSVFRTLTDLELIEAFQAELLSQIACLHGDIEAEVRDTLEFVFEGYTYFLSYDADDDIFDVSVLGTIEETDELETRDDDDED